MKKVITVVGARPQFIKAAVVSPLLREKNEEIIVHTGQHYDYNMSEQFFEQLSIPQPNYNLGISGGSHAQMTGQMMMSLEDIIYNVKPDAMLVYGDTNSTLAAALVAAKIHVPIYHVEAGVRTHSMTNPEEINRICTDHISSMLFACTEASMEELKREGLYEKSYLSGDLMYDAFIRYSNNMKLEDIELKTLSGDIIRVENRYNYLTCHREENTDDKKLKEILDAMSDLNMETIYPVHPRNKERIKRLCTDNQYNNIKFVEPVGYLESIVLVNNSELVVTDSGGVQREAFWAKKKCITILNFPVWIETMVDNRNLLAKPEKKDILEKLQVPQYIDEKYRPFGDGNAANKIVKIINTL